MKNSHRINNASIAHHLPGKLSEGDVEQHPLLTDNNSFSLIDQLDGNLSLSSHDSSLSELKPESLPQSSCIPVIVTHRPYVSKSLPYPRLPSVRKTVRRDNKALQAVTLPKMSSYNMRSLMPKCENFGTDMETRGCSLSFLTEIWQKSENKKHNLKIEELLELRGLQYISTPRPGNRRGGWGSHCSKHREIFTIKIECSNTKMSGSGLGTHKTIRNNRKNI